MKLSTYFCPVQKDVSSEVKLISHKYSIRAGLIKQCGSGIYTWLPIGLRIIDKISSIIDKEMQKIAFNKILMPCIQQASLWKESGRYDSYGQEMLKMQDRHGQDMLFGPTNEELITHVTKNLIPSYKSMPVYLYHNQWKFRDEIRPRFGLLRAREFLMKDGYSFDIDRESAIESYHLVFAAYLSIFKNIGLSVIPSLADTGPIGGDISHEFHILNDSGSEEEIVFDPEILTLIESFNEEKINREFYESKEHKKHTQKILSKYSKVKNDSDENNVQYKSHRGIELAHTFYFGTKYSEKLNASFKDKNGSLKNFFMGSYGIGISRLIAAIIEVHHDENGIIWPESISPFKIILVNIHNETLTQALKLYKKLDREKVLFDDTNESTGKKLARADLLGIPYKAIISKRTMENNQVELINRRTNIKELKDIAEIEKMYKKSSQ
ncbi:proline--tRNA ligase [Anaplasmataceae bacterium AB001_6]|nr:proline--tRNA ligase [Anaplasmataceae bacterium AB001_6]